MRAFLLALTLVFAASAAHAQPYPSKPIRVLVPFAPGGVTDIAARLVGQKLSEAWGQQVVIDNRTGAGGIVGVEAAAKASPDGYTVLMATSGEFAINPALYAKLPYDPAADFIPVAMVTNTPLMWVASANSSFATINDLVSAAKSRPGDIAYSTPGTGTVNHLIGEWFAFAANVRLLHVAYRGGAPAAVAIAGGDVPVGVVAVSSALPHIRSGKVKVLGLLSEKRASFAPEWSTTAEFGYGGVDGSIWVGLFAPKGVPEPIVGKLHADVNRVLTDDTVRKRLADVGAETAPTSREQFSERIKTDAQKFSSIIKRANIRIE